ncbi:MAG: thioredoxin domain-containing protein [Rhodomicrobium sp.]
MASNRLSEETSPYLQQHKDNPVEWWPWCQDAFAEAQRLDKPVLLSVGYAACHWCHVMAHESFEKEDTAALMNELFVNIKVDREERPDVDTLYMTALQELGEQGGWPLTMFLTPDGMPFFGGTYFPDTPRHGRPSFKQVLENVARVYAQEKETIAQNTAYLKSRLTPRLNYGAAPEFSEEQLAAVASKFIGAIDPTNGGLRGAPKFPNTAIFHFLWKAGLRYGLKTCIEEVKNTLLHICQGGIYDHVGGGFARYSVDERWLVPHFEKMLYDNAVLIELMTEVWKETQSDRLKARVAETIAWLERDMLVPGGGFAASYDADSEGDEGKFYVWTAAEITDLLGNGEQAAIFAQVYDVTEGGNWEGKTILNRLNALALLSRDEELALDQCRAKLFEAREKRKKPGWDDKVLADWNGLAIRAIAKAGDVFRHPEWIALAEKAYTFAVNQMVRDGRLFHSFRHGKLKAPATSADYANMISAALAMLQVTGEKRYLDDAIAWTAVMNRHYSADNGGYYLAADDTSDLILRPLSASDDATPNPNATMLQNLADLYTLTGDALYLSRADGLLEAFQGAAQSMAIAYTGLLSGAFTLIAPQHIVIAGDRSSEDAAAWHKALTEVSLPDALVQWVEDGAAIPASSPAAGKGRIDGKTTAYVCIGQRCSMPLTDPERLKEELKKERSVAVQVAASPI